MKIVINENLRLAQIVSEIKSTTDTVVQVIVEANSIMNENRENIKYLENVTYSVGKMWHMSDMMQPPTQSEIGADLVKSDQNHITEVASTDQSNHQQKSSKRFSVRPGRLLLGVVVMMILGLVGAGLFVYYYLPQGTVILYVAEKDVQRSATIFVDTSLNEVNPNSMTIPGKIIAVEKETSSEFNATGKKTVGEKATGSIEVYNFKTTSDLQLRTGTVIYATSGSERLTYSLTSGVTIPPATISVGNQGLPSIVAGVNKVNITASDIGDTYNLIANSQFLIEGFNIDESYARNPVALSGGSSREVTIVTKEDQQKAETEIKAKVEADLIKEVEAQINSSETYSRDNIVFSNNYITYNKNIDEETAKFTATIKAQARVTVIANSDVKALLQADVKANLPVGYEMSNAEQIVKIDKSEIANDKLQVSATVTALIIPVLDLNQIKSELTGKKIDAAENYLKSIEKVSGFDINIRPKLPSAIAHLPGIANRLEVSVQTLAQ